MSLLIVKCVEIPSKLILFILYSVLCVKCWFFVFLFFFFLHNKFKSVEIKDLLKITIPTFCNLQQTQTLCRKEVKKMMLHGRWLAKISIQKLQRT